MKNHCERLLDLKGKRKRKIIYFSYDFLFGYGKLVELLENDSIRLIKLFVFMFQNRKSQFLKLAHTSQLID